MRRPLPPAAAALALLPAGCTFGPSVPVLLGDADAAEVRLQLDAAWRDHIDASRRKDLDAMMALYTDDAVYAVAGAPLVQGRAALQAMERRGIAAGEVVAAAHWLEALRVTDDVALELGTVAGTVTPTGEPPQRVVFHFTALWRFLPATGWRIAHLVGETGTGG